MSASDKKKLRKEQAAAAMTEKQKQAQAEAKKLKIYTISFVVVIALLFCTVVAVLGIRAVNHSGVIQKNTIAATIGDRELNTVEFGYYYSDAINDFYNEWYEQYTSYTDAYLSILGLDVTKPLDKQLYDEEKGTTWAQYFVTTAINNAASEFALYDKAQAEGFQLPAEAQTNLDNTINSLETYAMLYGYQNANQYLRNMYGYGADTKSYEEYVRRSTIASEFMTAHYEGLSYDDPQIREYEKKDPNKYNLYDYSYAYLSYTDFREGGTKNENGTLEYSDAENEAARVAMKVAADKLAAAKTVDEMKELIKDIKVNESSQLVVNDYDNELDSSINATLADWLADDARVEGEIAAVANTSTTKDADGKETTVTNGYYVVCFKSKDDNTRLMSDVRHLLVKFEGGTKDEKTNVTTYSDAEKAAAKEEAEGYLKTWTEGAKTEESFIELVKKHSDDTSASTGGLFEDIHPKSNYVAPFREWATDPTRQVGDAEVIETEFGYHVMYYVGQGETSYRDVLIKDDMRNEDHQAWYDALVKDATGAEKDISKLPLDYVIKG